MTVFLLFVTGILITGFLFYQSQRQHIKTDAQNNLAAIADLKVDQIAQWRNEQVNDAEIIFDDALFARQVETYFKDPSASNRKQELLNSMKTFQNHFKYESILLTDAKGTVRLSLSAHDDTTEPHSHELIKDAFLQRRAIFSDLNSTNFSPSVNIDLAIPLILSNRKDMTIAGGLLLRIDPNRSLFPIIQKWPTPSRSSETLLLERNFDEVVYLNELRHQKATTHIFRVPISSEELPASMAARGIEGTIEGKDYRNVPVLAVVRKIINTPWFMIAKVDQEEIFAPLQLQAWIVGLGTFLLILSTGAIIGFWWRHQRARFYLEQYEAQLERQALVKHFEYLIKYANDIILLVDMDGRIVEANDQACRTYGYTQEEIHRLRIQDIRINESPSEIETQMKHDEDREGLVFETEHRRKDGTKFSVEISSQFIKIEGKRFFQSIIRDITERKHAEESLVQSLSLLKAAFDSTADGILVVNREGKITGSNEQFAKMWNIPKDIISAGDDERALRYVLAQLKEPDTFINKVKELYNQPEAISFDTLEFKNERVIERYSHPQLIDGKPVGRVWSFRDITEQKNAEEALRQSEGLFKTLVEYSPISIAVFSGQDQNIEYVSHSFTELFGYEHADVPSLSTWWPLAYPIEEYRNQIEAAWRTSIERSRQENREPEPIESVITCKDGSTRYIESTQSFMGELTLIFFSDLTQRRMAEEALRQTHAFNDLLIQTMPFGMNIVDEDGTILFISKTMKEMLTVDAVDMCCWQVYKDDNQQCQTCPLKKGISFGKPDVFETTGVLGGKTFLISHVGMMYEGRKAMLEVFQDITEQKKLQQELTQSQKMLSIGTLAGGIAHDFNNILAIILGYSSILHSMKDNPEKFSYAVSAIKQAVDRGAGLVRQILTFARKTEIAFEPMVIPDLVRELVSMLEQTFPKIITFTIEIEPELPLINADHTQIHQILLNLCVNARDAMPKGGVITIKVHTAMGGKLHERFPEANKGGYICITVSDTGIGMDETTRDRIFDPFFTTKEKGKGTGLGLSVVYGVVQAHHGFVDVESAVGSGTIFRLYLPVPNEIITAVDAVNGKEKVHGGTETILIVEDEDLLLEMIQLLLETHGYTVLTAKDGMEAVNVYTKHAREIALVISDMGLPKLSGEHEFKTIKEINPAVKMILASGYFEPEIKATLESAGVLGFLQKPYVIEEVLAKIRTALD
jgi:PAS domain S-box-containing protein